MATKTRGKAAKPTQKPRKCDMSDFQQYYVVSIAISNKDHAERIQRAIHDKCGFNMELLTYAR